MTSPLQSFFEELDPDLKDIEEFTVSLEAGGKMETCRHSKASLQAQILGRDIKSILQGYIGRTNLHTMKITVELEGNGVTRKVCSVIQRNKPACTLTAQPPQKPALSGTVFNLPLRLPDQKAESPEEATEANTTAKRKIVRGLQASLMRTVAFQPKPYQTVLYTAESTYPELTSRQIRAGIRKTISRGFLALTDGYIQLTDKGQEYMTLVMKNPQHKTFRPPTHSSA